MIAYLWHIKQIAQTHWQQPIDRAVIGRPVFFVDDDPRRDAKAQQPLLEAACAAGITRVEFQFEPIAAALDYESRLRASDGERLVLVADIGGGTSDFSVVRASEAAHARTDRRADILANHGLHLAGTDFDRAVSLAKIMPVLGLNGSGPGGLPVPSKIYFDLATWHLINTTYAPNRLIELRMMRNMYDDQRAHQRLMRVLTQLRGHDLAACSTDLDFLAAQLAGAFPAAQAVRGDRYANVVSGLAITAQRRFRPEVGSRTNGGGLSV